MLTGTNRIRTTRAHRLRLEANKARALRAQLAASGAPPASPDGLISFLCAWQDVSDSVLTFLRAADLARLEASSRALGRFHKRTPRPGSGKLYGAGAGRSAVVGSCATLPLHGDVVWRQLWVDSTLRSRLDGDKTWRKSVWGRRCRSPIREDSKVDLVDEAKESATGRSGARIRLHGNPRTTGQNRARATDGHRRPQQRQHQSRTSGTGIARRTVPSTDAASAAAVKPALAPVPDNLHLVSSSQSSTASSSSAVASWRNVYRAASLLWSRRLTAKVFRGYKKRLTAGDTCQSLQRSVSGCQLTSVDLLVNGRPYYQLLKNSSQHTRLWTSQANRVTSTLSSDGVRFFCNSLAVKVDWTPTSQVSAGGNRKGSGGAPAESDGVSCLEDLTSLQLWATSRTLHRRRKIFSLELPTEKGFKANGFMEPKGKGRAAGKHESGRSGAGPCENGLRSRPYGSVKRMPWKDYLVLEDGEFRLYEIPEDAFLPEGATLQQPGRVGDDATPSSHVDVRSSVVLGTWGRNGEHETIAFCMIHVHLAQALHRMLLPLPRGMSFYNRPPVDDLHAWAGTRGYSLMVALRSFTRCNWEFGEKDFDFEVGKRDRMTGFATSKMLCDGENLSWDASRHLSNVPDLFCRTPCFSTTVRGAVVVELSLIDELGNVVWGTVEVTKVQPIAALLGRRNSGICSSGNSNSRQVAFWESVQQRPFSMDVSMDTDSRCGFEVRSRVGALNVALCRMDAESARTTEEVMAVECLEISLEDTWRKSWFPTS